MALRDGMGTLAQRLRQMTQTGTADYVLAGTTYWTDAQLQDYMDRHVLILNHARMVSDPEWNNGTLEYHDYYTPRGIGNLETADSGTQYFDLEEIDGDDVTLSDFEITDYNAGWFRHTADTKGTEYQIKARSYNLHAAAADIWDAKAASVWEMIDLRSDGEGMSLSQIEAHAEKQAAKHRKLAGVKTTRLRGLR